MTTVQASVIQTHTDLPLCLAEIVSEYTKLKCSNCTRRDVEAARIASNVMMKSVLATHETVCYFLKFAKVLRLSAINLGGRGCCDIRIDFDWGPSASFMHHRSKSGANIRFERPGTTERVKITFGKLNQFSGSSEGYLEDLLLEPPQLFQSCLSN